MGFFLSNSTADWTQICGSFSNWIGRIFIPFSLPYPFPCIINNYLIHIEWYENTTKTADKIYGHCVWCGRLLMVNYNETGRWPVSNLKLKPKPSELMLENRTQLSVQIHHNNVISTSSCCQNAKQHTIHKKTQTNKKQQHYINSQWPH